MQVVRALVMQRPIEVYKIHKCLWKHPKEYVLGRNDTQHNGTQYTRTLHYAECRDYLNLMISVVMLSVAVPVLVAVKFRDFFTECPHFSTELRTVFRPGNTT
jgi:hypothetical protein